MAQPTPYVREFNFSNQQAETPSEPLPAPHVDAEFNRIKLTTDEILENLSLIQNDSGELIGNFTSLPDAIVTVPTLAADVLALISTGGTLPELEAVADYVIDEIAAAPAASAGVDTILGVKDGAIVNGAVPGFYPDNYGGKDNAAVQAAFAAAQSAGGPLLLPYGNYTITEPLVLSSNQHVIIMPGAALVAHATDFVGTNIIQVGTTSDKAFNFSISGGGSLHGNNIADMIGIEVVWGYRSMIRNINIFGCPKHGVKAGSKPGSGVNTSYQIELRDVMAFNGSPTDVAVANVAGSIGIFMDNCTDSILFGTYAIGYRRGIETSTTAASTTLIANHPWNRDTHGPLERAFSLLGRSPIGFGNYADNPTIYDGAGNTTIAEAYGFYLHGVLPMMYGNHVLTASDARAIDNTVTAIYMDQEVDGRILGTIFEGGVTGTRRYKSLFSGGSNRTSFRDSVFPPSGFVVDTASLKFVETVSNNAAIAYDRAQRYFLDDAVFQDRARIENAIGLEIKENASGNSDIVFQNENGVACWIFRKDSSDNLVNSRRNPATGASVDTPIVVNNSTGVITASSAVSATADAEVGGKLVLNPAASVAPADNGEMVFQLTSNTSLTIKVKGSDGVTRSGSITLS